MIHLLSRVLPFEGGQNPCMTYFKQKSNVESMHGHIISLSRYKVRRDPGFEQIFRFIFHLVMVPRYFWDSITACAMQELKVWFFFGISLFEAPWAYLLYCIITLMSYSLLMLSSVDGKGHSCKNKRRRIGYCESWMVLSEYMHFKCWTGYLTKINEEPILPCTNIHKLALKGIFMLSLACSHSQSIMFKRKGILLERTRDLVELAENFRYRVERGEGLNHGSYPEYSINLKDICNVNELSPEEAEVLLNAPIDFRETSCFAVETTQDLAFKDVCETVLSHQNSTAEDNKISFDSSLRTLFGLDNCATGHICKDKSLFVGKIKPLKDSGVKGVGGIAVPAGIGTIKFTIKDSEGAHHEITLDNVIK